MNSLTAYVTNLNLTNGGATPPADLPFFVDGGRNFAAYTGSFEGTWQKVGFAARIAVNPALEADRSRLACSAPRRRRSPAIPTRPQMMFDPAHQHRDALCARHGFAGNGVSYTGTLTDFTRRVVEGQGRVGGGERRQHQ